MDNEIFALIKEAKEKIKLWKDLGTAKSELICKGKDDALCRVRVSFYNNKTESLEGQFGSNKMVSEEEYLGYFFIGGDKYYFQSKAHVTGSFIEIPIPAELYRLQRRQNYRVRIPEVYPAFYNIITINGNAEEIVGRMADLSSQGCRVVYRMDSPLLKLGDKVMGHLIIGRRAPIEVQGLIRHIKVDDTNTVVQTFGIEFSPLPSIVENKLFAITMETYKQLFKRPS